MYMIYILKYYSGFCVEKWIKAESLLQKLLLYVVQLRNEGDSIRVVERWIMCWDITELDEFLDCVLGDGGNGERKKNQELVLA